MRDNRTLFSAGGEKIPLLAEQLIGSLGREYTSVLSDRQMWPLKVTEIPSSAASRMDGIANLYIRKWLGLLRCFSDINLFGKNILHLPLKSISLGYKQEKTHLVLELTESRDTTGVTIRTECKWRAREEVGKAIIRLQHKEFLGRTQVKQITELVCSQYSMIKLTVYTVNIK